MLPQTNFVSFHIVIIAINTWIIKFLHYQILVFFISFSSTSNFFVLIWFLFGKSIATLEFHQPIFLFFLLSSVTWIIQCQNLKSLKKIPPSGSLIKLYFVLFLIQTTNFILSWPWVKSYTCKYLKLPFIFLIHSPIDFLSNYFHPMYLIIIRDEGRTKCLHPHPSEHCGSCPSLININASREVSQAKTNCFNVKSWHSSSSGAFWDGFGQGWLLEEHYTSWSFMLLSDLMLNDSSRKEGEGFLLPFILLWNHSNLFHLFITLRMQHFPKEIHCWIKGGSGTQNKWGW